MTRAQQLLLLQAQQVAGDLAHGLAGHPLAGKADILVGELAALLFLETHPMYGKAAGVPTGGQPPKPAA